MTEELEASDSPSIPSQVGGPFGSSTKRKFRKPPPERSWIWQHGIKVTKVLIHIQVPSMLRRFTSTAMVLPTLPITSVQLPIISLAPAMNLAILQSLFMLNW